MTAATLYACQHVVKLAVTALTFGTVYGRLRAYYEVEQGVIQHIMVWRNLTYIYSVIGLLVMGILLAIMIDVVPKQSPFRWQPLAALLLTVTPYFGVIIVSAHPEETRLSISVLTFLTLFSIFL